MTGFVYAMVSGDQKVNLSVEAGYAPQSRNYKRYPLPDAGFIRSALHYDHETGIFTWRHRVGIYRGINNRCAGTIAGTPDGNGYISIRIDQHRFKAHRLAWCWMMGSDPASDIDHIDCDRSNNRFANLRIATRTQNLGNSSKRFDNTSGHKGVCWDKRAKKWKASICISGNSMHLGNFYNIEDAAEAYKRAAINHFGEEFARVL